MFGELVLKIIVSKILCVCVNSHAGLRRHWTHTHTHTVMVLHQPDQQIKA